MHSDTGSSGSFSSTFRNCSVSCDSSVTSKSSYSSRSVGSHHIVIVDQGMASPCQTKWAHTYLGSTGDICHNPVKNDHRIYAIFAAPKNKRSKKTKHTCQQKTCFMCHCHLRFLDLNLNEFQLVNSILN